MVTNLFFTCLALLCSALSFYVFILSRLKEPVTGSFFIVLSILFMFTFVIDVLNYFFDLHVILTRFFTFHVFTIGALLYIIYVYRRTLR